MAEIANHAGKEPWPSLDWATWIFDRASIVLAASLLFGCVATFSIVWLGIVKEHHWDLLREKANIEVGKANVAAAAAHERAAGLEKQAEEARGAIAEANARAAEAAQKAAEAQLALEKFKAPRLIRAESMSPVISKLTPFAGTPFDMSLIPGDPEAAMLMVQIGAILEMAGWKWMDFNRPGGPFMTVFNVPGKPNVGQGGNWGVAIQAHDESATAFAPAMQVLADALTTEDVLATAGGMPNSGIPNKDTVHVIVGRKP